MANDIKQRIVLEGEKEYNAAIKEAQRNLKVLRSELKAETAELGKNASEQQKAEVKRKNLQKQIKEQEKVVKTYEEALKEVREKYGENEEAVAKWEIKLNQARATLAGLKDGLTDTGNSMKSVATEMNTGITAANSLADSFSKLGELGASVSSSIESLFFGLLDNVHTAVSAIWGELMDVASKSDNYLDLASYFGATASEVQKWDSAMKAANGSLDTVTSLITKLKYSGKGQTVAEWFGVSDANYLNDLEYFQAVMTSMYQKRDEMRAAGTWDQAMVDIFGNKKGADVENVLSDWLDILNGLDRFNADENGFGLTDEEIEKMGDLAVKVSTLKESWEALKNMAVVKLFGDLALNVTGNLQNIIDGFKEYFDAEDQAGRDAALDKIKTNIEDMFKAIAEVVTQGIAILGEVAADLKNSEDPLVRAFGEFLDKIHNMLSWAMDPANWETIKQGFEALIGVWATGKILTALGNIASFASHIATIRAGGGLFGTLFGGGGGGGSAAAAAGGSSAGGTAAAASGGFLAKLFTGAKSLVFGAAQTAPFALPAVLMGERLAWMNEFIKESEAAAQASKERYDVMSKGFQGSEYFDMWKTLTDYSTINGSGAGTDDTNMVEFAKHYIEWLNSDVEDTLLDKLSESMSDDQFDQFTDAMSSIMNGDHFYSDEDINNLLTPIQSVIDLLEQEMADNQSFGADLPADWWNTLINKDQITAEDLSGFREVPGQMERAVRAGVSGISISMDGYSVAQVVAPYVSEMIARDIPY